MIKSFKGKWAEPIFNDEVPRGFPADVVKVARRKLNMVNRATRLNDLRIPPANHLEALAGSRAGQLSIRINKKWRVCFVWDGDGAMDVEIVDYH